MNKLSAALEDLSDEAAVLRRKAGLPADQPLNTAGVKLQKDITIAQLRSVNALLERQVRDLTGLTVKAPPSNVCCSAHCADGMDRHIASWYRYLALSGCSLG